MGHTTGVVCFQGEVKFIRNLVGFDLGFQMIRILNYRKYRSTNVTKNIYPCVCSSLRPDTDEDVVLWH